MVGGGKAHHKVAGVCLERVSTSTENNAWVWQGQTPGRTSQNAGAHPLLGMPWSPGNGGTMVSEPERQESSAEGPFRGELENSTSEPSTGLRASFRKSVSQVTDSKASSSV